MYRELAKYLERDEIERFKPLLCGQKRKPVWKTDFRSGMLVCVCLFSLGRVLPGLSHDVILKKHSSQYCRVCVFIPKFQGELVYTGDFVGRSFGTIYGNGGGSGSYLKNPFKCLTHTAGGGGVFNLTYRAFNSTVLGKPGLL